MRLFLQFAVVLIATIPWILGYLLFGIAYLIHKLGTAILGKSNYGNCWTFAMPKWVEHGGYLLIRPADGQRILNYIKVPHVAWVKNLDPKCVEVEQYSPVTRYSTNIFPWYALFYEGEVKNYEVPHPSDDTSWDDL